MADKKEQPRTQQVEQASLFLSAVPQQAPQGYPSHLFLCNPLLTLQSYSPLPRFQAVCRPFTPEHALFSCNSVTQLMATFPLFTCAPSSPDIPDVLLLHHLAANWTPTAQPDSQKHFWSQGLPCLLSVNRKSCIPDISLTDGISNSNF